MEIRVNIPKNDYVQPTEIRENVVQGICEAFLNGQGYTPYITPYGPSTNGIVRRKGERKFFAFSSSPRRDEEYVKFNGAEMKAAFDALIKAGYYMYKNCYIYFCDKKPYYRDSSGFVTRVASFNDFID